MATEQGRYAEGTREPIVCKRCGSPAVRVYHGPRANHTIEPLFVPLSEEELAIYEEARRSIVEARSAALKGGGV